MNIVTGVIIEAYCLAEAKKKAVRWRPPHFLCAVVTHSSPPTCCLGCIRARWISTTKTATRTKRWPRQALPASTVPPLTTAHRCLHRRGMESAGKLHRVATHLVPCPKVLAATARTVQVCGCAWLLLWLVWLCLWLCCCVAVVVLLWLCCCGFVVVAVAVAAAWRGCDSNTGSPVLQTLAVGVADADEAGIRLTHVAEPQGGTHALFALRPHVSPRTVYLLAPLPAQRTHLQLLAATAVSLQIMWTQKSRSTL